MEDDLNENGRRPQSLASGRLPLIFQQIEDNLKFRENVGQSQVFGKWKTFLIFWQTGRQTKPNTYTSQALDFPILPCNTHTS